MLEEDLQRAEIQFPVEIPTEKAKDLLTYISKKSESDISYNVNQLVHLRVSYGDDEEYVREISGDIRPKDLSAMSSFSLIRHDPSETPTRFKAIKFSLVPGYEVNEGPNAKILAVADNTRQLIEQYFAEIA